MTILEDDAFVRLFQERVGLEVDGWAGKATLAALDRVWPPRRPPASVGAQIPDDYWPMLSKIESGDQPYVRARTSTASGLYQFIRSTWIGEGGAWGDAAFDAFGGLRPSVEEQLARAKTFTAKNADYLVKRGVPINKASLYAAHFFGAVTAARVIAADVKADAAALAGASATKANPSILTRADAGKRRGATVGEFLTWLHGKTGEWAR